MVYIVYVSDLTNVLHRLIIEAGDGRILSSEELGVGFTIQPPSLIGDQTQELQESLTPHAPSDLTPFEFHNRSSISDDEDTNER